MKPNKNHKAKLVVLFLAVSFLFLGCSSTNQNEIGELEIRNTESLNNLQTEEDVQIEGSSEVEKTEETTIGDSQIEETEIQQNQIMKINNSTTELTEDEIASLIFMREEEKLAKDVYLGLYDLWGLPIFQNIANSEQTHTDAVKRLLDRFGIEDPADNSPIGIFANEDLQKMYDDLMVAGSRSLGDALKVGGAIEEIDILDLQEALDETENPDIQRVYQNLLRGSENHLRAFTSTLLQQTGETYLPQYMDVNAYDEILARAPARGGRGNNRRP